MIYLDAQNREGQKREENYSACADLKFAFLACLLFLPFSAKVLKCDLKFVHVKLVKYLIFVQIFFASKKCNTY